MARAIFLSDSNYSSRKRNAGWSVKADPSPQAFPSELIDAAVGAGVAERFSAKPARGPEPQGRVPEAEGQA